MEKARREWLKANKERADSAAKVAHKLPKVLIVEDNTFNLVPIKITLDRHKIDYDIAKNGLMAVDRYTNKIKQRFVICFSPYRSGYEVILMDIEMPLMNGYEATEQIRAMEKEGKIPRTFICGLSAATDASKICTLKLIEAIEKCKECGMDEYLAKPVSMDKMIELVMGEFKKKQNYSF